MPGIVAAIDLAARPGQEARFRAMLEASQARPFPQVASWGEDAGRAHLGRVDLGLLEPSAGPASTPDGRYTAIFTGEIVEPSRHAEKLQAMGLPLSGAGIVLATWLQDGPDGLARLNGSYAFAIWDAEAARLTAGTDRYASRPHFYAVEGDRLVLAPETRGVIAGLGRTPAPDRLGMAEFLDLEYPLADHTFFEGVHHLPPGTLVQFDAEGERRIVYWAPEYVYDGPIRDPEAFLEEAVALYRQAVARRLDGDVAVSVSGGTDSRLILAVADRRDMSAVTFGDDGTPDVEIARQVAALLGLEHHVVPLSEDFMAANVATIMTWMEGMSSLFHGHNGDRLEIKRQFAPIELKGMTAEYCRLDVVESILAEPPRSSAHGLGLLARRAMTGGPVLSRFESEEALAERLLSRIWYCVTPQMAQQVLDPDFAGFLAEAVPASVAQALAALPGQSDVDRLASFNVRHRQVRFTTFGLRASMSSKEVRKPLDDYDLVDFLLKAPPESRRKLQDAVIRRAHPGLASLPRTGGAPIDAGTLRRAALFAEKRLRQRLDSTRKQSFANPHENMRGAARGFWQELLLDPATLHNGFVHPQRFKALVEAHMAGKVNAGSVLCALGTIELWRRRFFETPAERVSA